jgi:hypothetical protein
VAPFVKSSAFIALVGGGAAGVLFAVAILALRAVREGPAVVLHADAWIEAGALFGLGTFMGVLIGVCVGFPTLVLLARVGIRGIGVSAAVAAALGAAYFWWVFEQTMWAALGGLIGAAAGAIGGLYASYRPPH